MVRHFEVVRGLCLAAIPIVGIVWLIDVPLHAGWNLQGPEYLLFVAGLAVAGGFLSKPYGQTVGRCDLAIATVGLLAWWWAAYKYDAWLLDIANRGPEKWIPAAASLVLLIEAIRKNCGSAITILVVAFVVYGLVGHLLPGAFEATRTPPSRYALYLYTDTNAVPGIVLHVGATIVLAFMVMGKVMEFSGASSFLADGALAAMGDRRGGPAKVAIVASSLFGSINSTAVGNIMSTGVVTIPLMKRVGFPPYYAGAVEAVASNGGQLAPPVMGTAAFLIADFLQIDYAEVALAAILPTIVYYLVLFIQVDRFAQKNGLTGLPRSELPRARTVIARGWIFLIPLALLLYLLFGLGYSPGKSALYTAAAVFLVATGRELVLCIVGRERRVTMLHPSTIVAITVDSGRALVPLLLVCAGAGIVVGVLNITGLGLQLVIILEHVATEAGILPMLTATAVVAVILGMGMPTSAVYVLLAVVLAPALVNLGIAPLSAHLFIFYFGMLSLLTPPVAVASFVAAGLAGSNFWRTGIAALRLGASAYLLPFLFVFNPALIGQGSTLAVAIAAITAIVSGGVLAYSIEGSRHRNALVAATMSPFLFIAAIAIGSAPVWAGPENLLALAPAALAIAARLCDPFKADRGSTGR
jgi:TRAP transporter 4TM/12TM fusion protein